MKKVIIAVGIMLGVAVCVHAGNQYNWGTSTGGSWVTPDDLTLLPNQFLVISSSVPASIVNKSTITFAGAPILMGMTISQINALTTGTTGQVVYCIDCTVTPVCVATSAAVANSFAAIASTSTTGRAPVCK